MKSVPVLFYREGTCALGAMISLIWRDQPFRLARLEEGDNENPDFLKLNGLGEVPTLYLDGTVITENVAVLQHIGLSDLSKRISFDPQSPQFDQLQRALGFLSSSFHKSFGPVFMGDAYHPDKKVQEEIKKNVVNGHLKEVVSHAEEHLLRTTLLFDQPTVGDAYLFAMSRWLNKIYNVEKEFPHFKRFQDAMAQDSAVKMALEIESGNLKTEKENFQGHVEFKTFVKEAAKRKAEVDQLTCELNAKPEASNPSNNPLENSF